MAILVLVLAYAVLYSIIPRVSANNEQVYIEHTVESGQTLWDIAVMYRSDADPRQVIYEIKQASGCDSVIKPGQVIKIPRG
ncbi:MAG: LysM peptidoglycan-binding domain-containing protein [Spirochaetales bacterium]|nr:LysM peptidoglycan-binding domain-containing protein [Spirochaetales bacterium]